jgi:hypothetical protein
MAPHHRIALTPLEAGSHFQSLAERSEPCLGDLFVFLGRREARAGGAGHLAIDHHR